MSRRVAIVVLATAVVAACGSQDEPATTIEVPVTITLTSPDFDEGGRIPSELTCDGEDRSPTLRWEGVPDGTAELALLVEDPDAPRGTFVHWVLWGVDPAVGELPGGPPPAGVMQGRNDFGRLGWGGPCPPRGAGDHRYVFTIYAEREPLPLEESATAHDLRAALEGRAIATGSLTGRYARS